jgi:hypothetical protein
MALISTGKYLKADSLTESGSSYKVLSCGEEDLPMGDDGTERKWVLHLEGLKPLILNATNTRRLVAAFGTAETDAWVGKHIIAYNDTSIEFAGKITGGVRLRSVPRKAGKGTAAAAAAAGDAADGMPF